MTSISTFPVFNPLILLLSALVSPLSIHFVSLSIPFFFLHLCLFYPCFSFVFLHILCGLKSRLFEKNLAKEMPQVASTRWCPTPEQLMILEEMYRGGIRTPNASQIQQITAHLSFYGRIEGKNVFYWFQNHKARDRQKLRRRLIRQQQQQQNQQQQTQQQMEDSAAAIRLPNENPPQFLHQVSFHYHFVVRLCWMFSSLFSHVFSSGLCFL